MRSLLLIVGFWILAQCSASSAAEPPQKPEIKQCRDDKARLEARQSELAHLLKSDQEERDGAKEWSVAKYNEKMIELARNGEIRRKRVGEIFGEGCFQSAKDYYAMGIIFQHGKVPDHFLQAYFWFKKAYELGDKDSKKFMAYAVDRYLFNSGYKTFFGTQGDRLSKETDCWCYYQLEPSFPQTQKLEFFGNHSPHQINLGGKCESVECPNKLSSAPKGSVPGLW